MGRCLQSVRSVHMLVARCTKPVTKAASAGQGAPRQLSAGQGALMQLQGLAGRGSLHNRHCQSKRIWPAATASTSYGQLCEGCMISAHAKPGTAQVAAQGALRQPQGVAGGGAPAGVGWSMRTGHEAAATCSRCVCFAAMQAANGQYLAEAVRCRETITAMITAGWCTQLLPSTAFLPFLLFLIPLKSFCPLYFLSSHLQMWPSCKGHLRE